MTETSSAATFSVPNASVAAMSAVEQMAYKVKQGRLLCGLGMKLVDDMGTCLPHDGRTPGRLMITGPTIARAYFGGEGGDVLDDEGVAIRDADGTAGGDRHYCVIAEYV